MTQSHRPIRTVPIAVAALALACGCEPEAPKPPVHPTRPVEEDWKTSALWLHATRDFNGGRGQQCEHVLGMLAEEARCRGQLCRFGAELAAEWLDKCTKIKPPLVDKASKLQAEMVDQTDRKSTDCARELKEMLADEGCPPDSCPARAQRWATRCGEVEAGPLATRMLERAVTGSTEAAEPVRLDERSCATLADLVKQGASCASEEECRKALGEAVATYDLRCQEDGQKPDIATGLYTLVIAFGAAREQTSIAISDEGQMAPSEAVPLVLADGGGAILRACYKRAEDIKGLVELRDGCDSGSLELIRVRVLASGGRELRLGRYVLGQQPPSLVTVLPWLEVAGEHRKLEAAAAASVTSGLAAVTGGPAAEAPGRLLLLAAAQRAWLRRSKEVQAALGAADKALAPVLASLGALKEQHAAATTDPDQLAELVYRWSLHPLADLAADPQSFAVTVAMGQPALLDFDAAELLPEAMAAYRAKLAAVTAKAQRAFKPRPTVTRKANGDVREAASACAAAERRMREIETQLAGCAFSEPPCFDSEQRPLFDEWEKLRAEAEKTRSGALAAVRLLGEAATEVIDEAQCKAPWW